MNFRYETKKIKSGFKYVIGCDEVGRGCLAGPVVAVAVVPLQVESYKVHKVIKLREVRDSKLLTSQKREELSEVIKKHFLWSIAEVSPEEIDEINIHNASLLAMKKAVESLWSAYSSQYHGGYGTRHELAQGGFLAVDGKFKVPGLSIAQESIIGGDNKVLSIAAASIIAKVYRDGLMKQLDSQYPAYNLKQHKGYATEHHRKVIIEKGLSPVHRLSFCQNLAI